MWGIHFLASSSLKRFQKRGVFLGKRPCCQPLKIPTVISRMSTEVNSLQTSKIWNSSTWWMWQNKASVLQRVPIIVRYLLFPYLPFPETFVEIWIERFDFLLDAPPNNGLSITTPPDEFKSPYFFPLIKEELLFFLKVNKSPFISSHVGNL